METLLILGLVVLMVAWFSVTFFNLLKTRQRVSTLAATTLYHVHSFNHSHTPLTTNASISRAHDGLRSVSDLELAQDVRDVVSYGFEAEDQLPGNCRVALSLRDQAEHLPFTFGEFGKCQC